MVDTLLYGEVCMHSSWCHGDDGMAWKVSRGSASRNSDKDRSLTLTYYISDTMIFIFYFTIGTGTLTDNG